jgi:hypothetical protein
MINQSATDANKSPEPPQIQPGTPTDPESTQQPQRVELPYKPYAKKPDLNDPPYEPYKGM